VVLLDYLAGTLCVIAAGIYFALKVLNERIFPDHSQNVVFRLLVETLRFARVVGLAGGPGLAEDRSLLNFTIRHRRCDPQYRSWSGSCSGASSFCSRSAATREPGRLSAIDPLGLPRQVHDSVDEEFLDGIARLPTEPPGVGILLVFPKIFRRQDQDICPATVV
jgi:hypothetical protein